MQPDSLPLAAVEIHYQGHVHILDLPGIRHILYIGLTIEDYTRLALVASAWRCAVADLIQRALESGVNDE
jgi:hypothetical protein